jgi:hypothetical protein
MKQISRQQQQQLKNKWLALVVKLFARRETYLINRFLKMHENKYLASFAIKARAVFEMHQCSLNQYDDV